MQNKNTVRILQETTGTGWRHAKRTPAHQLLHEEDPHPSWPTSQTPFTRGKRGQLKNIFKKDFFSIEKSAVFFIRCFN
jgi:hypothetical protein